MKKHVYRINDKVIITNPLFVKRVGYPLGIEDMLKELDTPESIKKIDDFIISFLPRYNKSIFNLMDTHYAPMNEIRKGLAYAMLRSRGFGGKTRSIHTELLPIFDSKLCTIDDKKIVHTGEYEPGYTTQSYDGDGDYQPAFISNRKHHVLLKLHPVEFIPHAFECTDPCRDLWIEENNVRENS